MTSSASLDENGFIWVINDGYIDGTKAQEIAKKISELVTDAQNQGRPIDLLIDNTKMKGASLEARKIGLNIMKKWPYRKMALFGNSRYLQHLVNLMIIASGRGSIMRVFSNKESAIAWLQE